MNDAARMGVVEIEAVDEYPVHEHGVTKGQAAADADDGRCAGAQFFERCQGNGREGIFCRSERDADGVEDQMLGALANRSGNVVIAERQRELRKHVGKRVIDLGRRRFIGQCAHRGRLLDLSARRPDSTTVFQVPPPCRGSSRYHRSIRHRGLRAACGPLPRGAKRPPVQLYGSLSDEQNARFNGCEAQCCTQRQCRARRNHRSGQFLSECDGRVRQLADRSNK